MVHNENSFDTESVSILSYIKANVVETINNDNYNILTSENVDAIYELINKLDKEHTNTICDEGEDKIHFTVEEIVKGYYTFKLVKDKKYFSSNNYVIIYGYVVELACLTNPPLSNTLSNNPAFVL